MSLGFSGQPATEWIESLREGRARPAASVTVCVLAVGGDLGC